MIRIYKGLMGQGKTCEFKESYIDDKKLRIFIQEFFDKSKEEERERVINQNLELLYKKYKTK